MLRPDVSITTITDVGTEQVKGSLVLSSQRRWSPWGGTLVFIGAIRPAGLAAGDLDLEVYDSTNRRIDSQTIAFALNETHKFGVQTAANYVGPLRVDATWNAGVNSAADIVLNVNEYNGLIERLVSLVQAFATKFLGRAATMNADGDPPC